jgi:hypothetical protein
MATNAKVKIVKGPVDAGKPGRARYRTAIAENGDKVRIRMLDPNSPTFTADFLSSFRANVRKARAENKALGLDV